MSFDMGQAVLDQVVGNNYKVASTCNKAGHHHNWPVSGPLNIERCEHYCAYCTGPKATKRWASAWFLRRHVREIHAKTDFPEVVVSEGWTKRPDGNTRPVNKKQRAPGSNKKKAGTKKDRQAAARAQQSGNTYMSPAQPISQQTVDMIFHAPQQNQQHANNMQLGYNVPINPQHLSVVNHIAQPGQPQAAATIGTQVAALAAPQPSNPLTAQRVIALYTSIHQNVPVDHFAAVIAAGHAPAGNVNNSTSSFDDFDISFILGSDTQMSEATMSTSVNDFVPGQSSPATSFVTQEELDNLFLPSANSNVATGITQDVAMDAGHGDETAFVGHAFDDGESNAFVAGQDFATLLQIEIDRMEQEHATANAVILPRGITEPALVIGTASPAADTTPVSTIDPALLAQDMVSTDLGSTNSTNDLFDYEAWIDASSDDALDTAYINSFSDAE